MLSLAFRIAFDEYDDLDTSFPQKRDPSGLRPAEGEWSNARVKRRQKLADGTWDVNHSKLYSSVLHSAAPGVLQLEERRTPRCTEQTQWRDVLFYELRTAESHVMRETS